MQCSVYLWIGTWAADLAFDNKMDDLKPKKGPKYQTHESADRFLMLARDGGI